MRGLLTLAFAAGMVAPVNPCGFALLPAWITHTLGDTGASSVPIRLLRALRAGAALTVGFAGTLAVAGLTVSTGARGLIRAAPWLGLVVGALLILLGLAMLAGRSLSLRLPGVPGRAAEGLPPMARMVVFGIGYAAASLSCTFGVLLAVIAQAQATTSLVGLGLVFGAYAAGSAAVLLLLALATAATGAALTHRVATVARYSPRIIAIVLLLTGAYLAWYWYPAATGDTTAAGRSGALTGLSATASGWIQGRTTPIAALAAIAALSVTILAIRRRPSRPPSPGLPAAASVETAQEADCCSPPDRSGSSLLGGSE